jgi:hypothetical protein
VPNRIALGKLLRHEQLRVTDANYFGKSGPLDRSNVLIRDLPATDDRDS